VGLDGQVSRERLQYEAKAAALVARKVLEVRYWDIRYFVGDPRIWDYGDWHHAVMGVELLTDRGPSCVLWTSTFYPYGVEVFHTPMSEHIVRCEAGPESWDASGSDRWRGKLSSSVTDVQVFWEQIAVGLAPAASAWGADSRTVDVPVALRIDFSAGPAWMVAGIPQAPEMQEVFMPGDEIMVVFSAERMRQIGFPDSEFVTVGRG
jgi:hypothetical protein